MEQTIQGIIFDMDGVIADTAEMHYHSWKQLADDEGIPFTRQDNERLRGVTRFVALQRFTEGLTLDDATRRAWFKRKNGYFQERMRTLKPGDSLPGIERLLDELDAAGLRKGVGSASRNARLVLEQIALTHRFEAIADGYTVSRSKPEPDVFIWVAGALGVSPENLIVIEDSEDGVQAALNGGFYVVGVGSAPVHRAHVVYDTLADVSLQQLIADVQVGKANADTQERIPTSQNS